MGYQILLKSQKNDLFRFIRNVGLDPFNFTFTEIPSSFNKDLIVSKILYNQTDFFYQFDFNKGSHYSIYSPGKDKLIEHQYPGSWDLQISYFLNWLDYLKREIEQPDLWLEVQKYQNSYDSKLDPDTTNTPFSYNEIEQILIGIQNLKHYLLTNFDLVENQISFVNENLDYLIEAAKRQGRKDWFHTSIGVIITIAMSLAISPEQTKVMWNFIKEAIIGFIKLLPK